MGVARRAGSRARRAVGGSLAASLARTPEDVARAIRIDPHWRRLDDGHAVRLGPRETIGVGHRVGRWRGVDPRVPEDRWRGWAKVMALGIWGSAVGAGWWVGASHGRGPLASVSELDDFGEAVLRPQRPTSGTDPV